MQSFKGFARADICQIKKIAFFLSSIQPQQTVNSNEKIIVVIDWKWSKKACLENKQNKQTDKWDEMRWNESKRNRYVCACGFHSVESKPYIICHIFPMQIYNGSKYCTHIYHFLATTAIHLEWKKKTKTRPFLWTNKRSFKSKSTRSHK